MKLSPAQQRVIDHMRKRPSGPVCVTALGVYLLHSRDDINMRAVTICALVKKGLLVKRGTPGKPSWRTDYYLVEETKQ